MTFLRCAFYTTPKQTQENVLQLHHMPTQTLLVQHLYIPVHIHETEIALLFEHVHNVCV